MHSGPIHPYQMDESISNFRGFWCTFSFYSISNRYSCQQTVKTLIRRRVLWRLICVCTVCLCPLKGTLGLYELIVLWRLCQVSKVDEYLWYVSQTSFHPRDPSVFFFSPETENDAICLSKIHLPLSYDNPNGDCTSDTLPPFPLSHVAVSADDSLPLSSWLGTVSLVMFV